jgi:hypothetical protein
LPERIATAFREVAPTPDFQSALRDPAVLADPANERVLDFVRDPAAGIGTQALNDSSFISALDPRLAEPFLIGFAEAIDAVFLLGAAVIAVAFAIVWFLPEEKLRDQSGIQAREEQETAAAASISTMASGSVVDDALEPAAPRPAAGEGRAAGRTD